MDNLDNLYEKIGTGVTGAVGPKLTSEEKKEGRFRRWESDTFGYGYGTGEMPVLRSVRVFFENLTPDNKYDHETLDRFLGGAITWLLINAFAKSDTIEYGTSPRYGWLTEKGVFVKDFIKDKTDIELYELIMREDLWTE
jgi:hypothetical protein